MHRETPLYYMTGIGMKFLVPFIFVVEAEDKAEAIRTRGWDIRTGEKQ